MDLLFGCMSKHSLIMNLKSLNESCPDSRERSNLELLDVT